MTPLIASSTTLFTATTGFAYSDLVTWAGNIVKLILGMGLGLVDSMLGWILALIAISVIIGLIYHAFKFFHILR